MKTRLNVVAAACLLAVVASDPAGAQELAVRSGTVTGIVPVQATTAEPAPARVAARTGGALGRAMGRLAGRAAARVSGEYAYDAALIANDATQETLAAAGASAGGQRTTTAYMVMVRFDNGQESSIRMAAAPDIRAGSRVRVLGYGDSARIVPQ